MRGVLIAIPVALALALSACGDDEEETPPPGAGAATEAETAEQGSDANGAGKSAEKAEKPKPEAKGTVIKVGDSQFGPVVFDGSDQAIYLFDKETTSKPECFGECAAAWPPVLTEGEPRAKGGIAQGKLGTTKRDGGELQVTYDGRPLYYYANEGPKIVACHNVDEFGGLWLAVQPDGKPVG